MIVGDSPQTVLSGVNGTAVEAVPDANYHFLNWSDSSTQNPRTDTNVTANISLTANFEADVIAVTATPDTWALGERTLSAAIESGTYTIQNTGNVAKDFETVGTDGAGGWTLAGVAGNNTFRVDVDKDDNGSYELVLSKTDQALFGDAAASGTKSVGLKYSAPSGDTLSADADQDFTVTVKDRSMFRDEQRTHDLAALAGWPSPAADGLPFDCARTAKTRCCAVCLGVILPGQHDDKSNDTKHGPNSGECSADGLGQVGTASPRVCIALNGNSGMGVTVLSRTAERMPKKGSARVTAFRLGGWPILVAILTTTALSSHAANIYVNHAAGGSNNGTSWANAYTTLAAGLADPNAGTRPILVAKGTYNEKGRTLVTGAKIYGGYDASTGNRDIDANVTTVNSDTTNRVFSATDKTGLVLDGLKITNGGGVTRGAGVYFLRSTGMIVNCTIQTCTATNMGGGVCLDAVSTVTLTGCTLTSNRATTRGGGLCFDNSAGTAASNLTLTNCTVTANTTPTGSYSGGGIGLAGSTAQSDTVIISGCTISQNKAHSWQAPPERDILFGGGGGIAAMFIDSVTVSGSNIVDNESCMLGGGLTMYVGDLVVTDCVLTGNIVKGGWASTAGDAKSTGGGAIHFQGPIVTDYSGSYTATVKKSRLTGNVVNVGGSGPALQIRIGTAAGGTLIANVENCLIADNTVNLDAGSSGGNLAIDIGKEIKPVQLTVNNCTFKNNVDIGSGGSSWWAAIYSQNNHASSVLTVQNCIFYGTSSVNHTGQALNHAGVPTFSALNNLYYQNESNGLTGTNPVLDDPDFLEGDGYGRVLSTSPAIDAGTNTGLTEDILGHTRPVDGPDADPDAEYDIGCYEWADTEREIDVSPTSLAFGEQDIAAGPTAEQTVKIVNQGSADLTITGVSLVGGDAGEFSIESDTGEGTLTAGTTRTVTVAFDPSTAGAKSASLRVTSNDSDEATVDVSLSGTGTEEGGVVSVTVTPDTWVLGQRPLDAVVESGTFTIENTGDVAADLEIVGTDGAGGWALQSSPGDDAFRVDVDKNDDGSYEMVLSKTDQALFGNVASSATRDIGLKYTAPSGDTVGAGTAQDFSVTVKASQYVP